MVARLQNIFDFQRFSKNQQLEKMIDAVERRYTELEDADLSFVNAAGNPFRQNMVHDKDKGQESE